MRGRAEAEGLGEPRQPAWCRAPSSEAAPTSRQAYLWDNNEVVVRWLEQHWQEEDGLRSTIRENIKYLKRDSVLKTIRK